MAIPPPLRGLISFVDRALDPPTAVRNARSAAADLSGQRRQREEVERALEDAPASVTGEALITSGEPN